MNNCDKCQEQSLVSMARSSVCTSCGFEKEVPYDLYEQTTNWNACTLQTVYSRKKRFGKLFDCVFTGCAQRKDEKMLKYLASRDIENMSDLIDSIKLAPLSDKRYGSLHCFARVYIPLFKPPFYKGNRFELRKRILRNFEDLEFEHRKKYPDDPFFNYRWLLKKLFHKNKMFQFDPYIKVIKCKHRRNHYVNMFDELSLNNPQLLWRTVIEV